MRCFSGFMAVAMLMLAGSFTAAAQTPGRSSAAMALSPIDGVVSDSSSRRMRPSEASALRTGGVRRRAAAVPGRARVAPVVSALLPGGGQYLLGQDRFVAYAALEVFSWVKLRNDHGDQTRQERQFRSLARDVARVNFSSNRPDGDWPYYEHMRGFLESGAYSLSNGAALVPETDTSTFNGALWRDVKSHNPDIPSALTEYQQRAVTPDFLWSWKNAQLEWDTYKRATEQRNDAARAVAYDVMIIGANHVLSMVDAFAVLRLQVRPRSAGGGGIGVSGSIPWSIR